jgi:transglutaminase-like putative cysteine protease
VTLLEEPALDADDDVRAEEIEDDEDDAPSAPPLRLAVAIAFPCLAAAVMVGGIFSGARGRIDAVIAMIAGVALAVAVSRLKRPAVTNVLLVGGVVAIGLALVATSAPDDVFNVGRLISQARAKGSLARPPVPYDPGWQVLLGWVCAMLAVTATWLAIVVRKPAFGVLAPLPVAAIAGISVPEGQQVASGIVALALFAVGLGLLSTAQTFGDGESPSLSFELRRAIRSLPFIGVITVLLYVLSRANFLFPAPFIDPTEEPQRPKTVPLSEVEDRVLFEVTSRITGPWRIGTLDVYDGTEWRLPPFADNRLDDVPRSGIVEPDLEPGIAAEFSVLGLEGTVLPGLPNTYGIQSTGPQLQYDGRSGSIRTADGEIERGLRYTVVAAALPAAEDLVEIEMRVPAELREQTGIPSPPAEVQALIDQAPATSKWEQFDYLRTWVLDNVVASGAGTPEAVPPSTVADMIGGSKEGSPFEIVAAQAMLARWVGIPSRIGYGYDGGEEVGGGVLAVRPKHGATFVEVWFPDQGWLPIIGTPKQAQTSVGSTEPQLTDSAVQPSDDIAVQLYLPRVVDPDSVFVQKVRDVVLLVLAVLLVVASVWTTWPVVRKARRRARRRKVAEALGPRGRIVVAYAEFRDLATDLGFGHATETPMQFAERFVEDDEHTELAWLVTRALWGDRVASSDERLAANTEELSRSMRRRMAQAQPMTLRVVAALSRLSLRDAWAPELDTASTTKAEEVIRELETA